MGQFQDMLTMYPGGLRGYLDDAEQLKKKEDDMTLPRGCTEIDMTAFTPQDGTAALGTANPAPAARPPSQFGNPVWTHDELPASEEVRVARKQGLQEALRLIEGPAIMTNSWEFQNALDSAIGLVKRRLAEL